MADQYVPELGQMMFGQPTQSFQTSDLMEAVLTLLQYRVQNLQWNLNQRDMPDPFSNSGGSFKCDAFEVEAYSWGDEEQPFNFKWGALEISWYKYMGRGMSANMDIPPELADRCLKDCLACLDRMEPTD